jgi:hypothetical protein
VRAAAIAVAGVAKGGVPDSAWRAGENVGALGRHGKCSLPGAKKEGGREGDRWERGSEGGKRKGGGERKAAVSKHPNVSGQPLEKNLKENEGMGIRWYWQRVVQEGSVSHPRSRGHCPGRHGWGTWKTRDAAGAKHQ